MSRQSLNQYQSHLAATGRAPKAPIDIRGTKPRSARTVPPPPAPMLDADMLAQAAQYEADASRLLARAADLRAAVARRNETENE
jgi:hypothetical protein